MNERTCTLCGGVFYTASGRRICPDCVESRRVQENPPYDDPKASVEVEVKDPDESEQCCCSMIDGHKHLCRACTKTVEEHDLYKRTLVLITEWLCSGDECSAAAQAALDGDVVTITGIEEYRRSEEGREEGSDAR